MSERDKILGVIRKFQESERCYEPEELADAIAEEISPSFTDIIFENNKVIQRCNLGHPHRIYPLTWRKEYIPVLHMFERYGRMTTASLGTLFPGQTARKCPSELVHFGLLDVCGKSEGNAVYVLSELAEAFLRGEKPVHEKVWPTDRELPSECECGRLRYIHEIEPLHCGTDRAMHVEEAVPV